MTKNAIESEFRTSKMVAGSHFVKKFKKFKKFRIDLKCRNASKAIFGYPKCPPKNTKILHRSEMARNTIESDFRISKMAAGGHFVKNLKKKFLIDMKWPEMRSKVNFGHPKWPLAAILSNISKNKKVPY